ncbi:MAG TPA: histidinol-phosphate transaminase [Pyrinomonadaceae bacterium]|nr:histidinol-phosphate transaminase [Pyrinomonadaceae bacterium]
MEFNLNKIVRENIKKLTPYSSARKEFSGEANIFLDANENGFGSPIPINYHRYPDPLQLEIKKIVALWNEVDVSEIFIGNGSDEAIDLLFRIFCEPKKDNILICPPTYGMYEVSAEINDVSIKRANLTSDFQLDFTEINRQIDENTKLVFFCSPNNPTGNSLNRSEILQFAKDFNGIVVIDEAYIHFSTEKPFVEEIKNLPNLVILRTFSKAWGLAGLRVGLAFANEEIISLFNKVKPPYNVSQIAQETILEALKHFESVEKNIGYIILEREKLATNLETLPFVQKIYASDANFVLVKTNDANSIYKFLLDETVVVRNRNNVELCEGCLRITIGTPDENAKLLAALKKYEESIVY